MIIYPAIDLKEGQVVRLKQGLAKEKTVYFKDAAIPAKTWKEAGAEWIHVVDLDGAFTGDGKNQDAIRRILESGLKIQLGGGIRSVEIIENWVNLGVERLVLGTIAADNPDFLKQVFDKVNPEHIAIGIDAKDGQVAVDGWTRILDLKATDFAQKVAELGTQTIIYTDISRDGMMIGPNFDTLKEMLDTVPIDIIASGGVSKKSDISELRKIKETHSNLNGVITGKALYDGAIQLKEIINN